MGQLDADLLDQQADLVCPTATQLSGLRMNTKSTFYSMCLLFFFLNFFFILIQQSEITLAAMQLFLTLTDFVKCSMKVFWLTSFC